MNTQGSIQKKASGFTAVELIVVIGVVVVLGILVLEKMARNNQRPHRIICVSNLKQIALAARMWSNDNGEKFPWQVSTSTNGTLELVSGPSVSPHFLSMSNELLSPKVLACTSDGKRPKAALWSEFDDTHLSYFVGLDSNEAKPRSILFGDRNITGGTKLTNTIYHFTSNSVVGFTKDLHNNCGNLALGDGSAQQVSPRDLKRVFDDDLLPSGRPALRLAIP